MGATMGVRDRVGSWFLRVAESLGASGAGTQFDDEAGYRRLSGRELRDLNPMDRDRMVKLSHFLYDSNPLAQWLIEQPINLILGDELGFSVEVNAKLAKLEPDKAAELEREIKLQLSRFWDHPAFPIRTRADELIVGLKVSGELCLPIASRNEVDGLPVIDYLDSELIADVQAVKGSSITPDLVVPKTKDLTPGTPKKIIRQRDGVLEGEVFFWRNSRLPNSMRGRTELHRLADWIDGLDQFLFTRVDRAVLANNVVHDVELTGASEAQVKAKAAEIRKSPPTKPGSIRVHNEREKWKTEVPDLASEDASQEVRLLRSHIFGSKGFPESWFSDGGEVTRTTASEQNDVALMALRRLRKEIKAIFELMLRYAYEQIRAAHGWEFEASAVKLSIDLPPLAERDISRLGGVIQNLESALELAVDKGFVSKRTAQKVFLHFIDRLGVPVDPDDERGQIEAEADDRAQADTDRQNELAAARLAGQLDGAAAEAGA